jgi:hypothetical protein
MKSSRKSNWELVVQSLEALGGARTAQELTEYFKCHFPETQPGNEGRKPSNVRMELAMLSVNVPGRLHYNISKPKFRRSDTGHPKDRIFFAGGGLYELYDPARHGIWEVFEGEDGKPRVRRVRGEILEHDLQHEPLSISRDQPEEPVEDEVTSGIPEVMVCESIPESPAPIKVPLAMTAESVTVPSETANGRDSFEEICKVLDSLALKRPIFHSEADFQHALAWEIGLLHPGTHIRLEIPSIFRERRASIDMLTRDESRVRFFELKYKTRGANVELNGETFILKQQSAHDQGASDFLKDVCRIEAFVAATPGAEGFAIMLTNDAKYWSDSFRSTVIDREFKLYQGREIGGTLSWLLSAGPGSIGKRERSLHLRNKYRVEWKEYSDLSSKGVPPYRYLCLQIQS